MYVDTHCHIIKEFYDDIESVLVSARENGVDKFIVCGYDINSNYEVLSLASKYEFVYAAIGFHPNDLDSFDIDFLEKHITDDKVVAIGEIGLDYHYECSEVDKKRQKEAFKKQIDIALNYNKPVIIHSRDSIMDTYNVLSAYDNLNGVLHCYSGSLEMAKKFVAKGFMLGIGGVVTFKNSKAIKEVVKDISLDHLLLETDSPYLAPEPYRGKLNSPVYIPLIAKEISLIKNVDIDDVATKTTANALRIFDF